MDENLIEIKDEEITYKTYFKSFVCSPDEVGLKMNEQLNIYINRHEDAWISTFQVVPLLGNLVLVVLQAMWSE